MWREARLAFTDSLAALDCSVVPAHPWIHGLGHSAAFSCLYCGNHAGRKKS